MQLEHLRLLSMDLSSGTMAPALIYNSEDGETGVSLNEAIQLSEEDSRESL